jgi:hypothetical protein
LGVVCVVVFTILGGPLGQTDRSASSYGDLIVKCVFDGERVLF